MRGFIRATGQRDCFLPITSMQCSLSTHVPTTLLHVPPWLSKRFVDISYVPIRSEQPSRSSCLISYVPMRSDYVPSRSAAEFEKSYRFPYVPKRSVQQYRKSLFDKIIMTACSTVSQINAGGLNAHTHIGIN